MRQGSARNVDDEVTHHDAALGELSFHYVAAGPPDGEPVLLLHGFPEFWYSWRHQLLAFADAGYRVYALDQRGYNSSSKPPKVSDYHINHLVEDVRALLEHLGVEQVNLIGHDWGAVVAWVFAMKHPGSLRRLGILNVPHPLRMVQGLRTLRQLRKSWYIGFFQLPVLPEKMLARDNFAGLRKIFAGTAVHEHAFTDDDLDRYVDAFRNEGALRGAINWYRAAARTRVKRHLAVIETPTMVIWGEQDVALGAELAHPPAEWVPNARVERLAEASHWVHCDDPEQVNRLLLQFLADI